MKSSLLVLLSVVSVAVLGACGDGTSDNLTGGASSSSSSGGAESGGGSTTPGGHTDVPSSVPSQAADPAQVRAVGSPEVTSRLHSCGKMTVSSLRQLLDSRGLTGSGQRPNKIPSGKAVLDQDETASTLGAASYDSRVPEAPFASTAAMSKMFDIFTLAAYDAVATDWSAPACPNVKLLGADGRFTKDGVSCLIGKPATDEHVALANDAITKNPTDGAKVAIAALLSAAHTCQ